MNSWLDTILRWLRIRKIRPHLSEGVILCDIGCGPHAQLLRDFSAYIKEGIGIDKKIPESTEGNIVLRNAFVENELPIDSSSVDAVTLLAVLEHLERPVEILKEAKRALRPGGTLLITVPTIPNRYVGEFLAYRLKVIDEAEYRDHKRYYSKRLLSEHLREAGFDLAKAKMKYFELGMNLFAKISV
uniref:Methyltransferase type 11 n=1 Tax=Candidatus Giovannonibacteria bacterium GW2011_GWF2_42_19 TaxID=1618659 RepID=A0A0G0ZAJ7_9BACT|nr:MAG: hypothetical protein UV11_C0043G0002 [Candidatus Giovannonibacteria bacterium GW2011_GWF2_42_19]